MSEKNQDLELDLAAPSGLERRRFLRNAAVAGVTAAWSAPLIQTVAYATGSHHPPPGSPFTPGECPRDTPTGDTHDHSHNNSNHSKDSNDKKNSNDTDSKRSHDTKDSNDPHDWQGWKNDWSKDSKDDFGGWDW